MYQVLSGLDICIPYLDDILIALQMRKNMYIILGKFLITSGNMGC